MLLKHINSDTVGQTVTLNGWVDKIRSSGKIAFISLRDGTEFIQCVIEEKHIGESAFAEITALGLESSLSLTGEISKHPKKEEYELQVR